MPSATRERLRIVQARLMVLLRREVSAAEAISWLIDFEAEQREQAGERA
jgi:hypothetical protein